MQLSATSQKGKKLDFGITRIVFGAPGFCPVPEAQYQEIAKAKLILRETLYIEQKFDFVICNYMEFEQALLEACFQGMVLEENKHSWFYSARGQFDRRIMNLLTTAISYSDAVPQHVNRIFERDTSLTDKVKAYYSQEYDARLGYRTMCKLRNFIQHQGFPVHGTTHSMHRRGEGDARAVRYTVNPYISTAELRDGDFNRTVLTELESVGDKVDLKQLIREYLDGLSAAHAKLRELLRETIAHAEAVIEEAIASYQKAFPTDDSIIGLAAVRRDDGPVYKDDLALIREPNKYRMQLAKKNRMSSSMVRSYVSSEVTENRF